MKYWFNGDTWDTSYKLAPALGRIPTRSRFLKAIAPYLNIVKMPFHALEYSTVDGYGA